MIRRDPTVWHGKIHRLAEVRADAVGARFRLSRRVADEVSASRAVLIVETRALVAVHVFMWMKEVEIMSHLVDQNLVQVLRTGGRTDFAATTHGATHTWSCPASRVTWVSTIPHNEPVSQIRLLRSEGANASGTKTQI